MNHRRKPLLILIVSLLVLGASAENALAHCLFSDLNVGNAVSQWVSLVIMSFMTATVFYLKFIYRRPAPARKAQSPDVTAAAGWEAHPGIAQELKIGQNFSSWAQLHRAGESGNG